MTARREKDAAGICDVATDFPLLRFDEHIRHVQESPELLDRVRIMRDF